MSLYKRRDSKVWWMRFMFHGRRIQQSTKCADKEAAKTIESAYRTQLALEQFGIKPKPKVPTFAQAVEDFLERAKLQHSDKARTHKSYKNGFKSMVVFFGDKKCDQIGIVEIEKYIAWRGKQISVFSKQPISGDTINYELGLLSILIRDLMKKKILSENPVDDVKKMPTNKRKFHVLNQHEEQQYLASASQPLADIAALMLDTGMRPSEVYSLQRENVHLQKNESFLVVVNGKTNASNRKVFLTEKSEEILRNRFNTVAGSNLFPFKNQEDTKPYSQMSNGERCAALSEFQKWLGKLHRETSLKLGYKFRIYDCRHTFATRAVEDDVDLRTLADLLGHATLSEVMRYSHVSDPRKKDAISKMEAAKKKRKDH